ncbi:MAG TPA: 4Fe-4S dicluster domain-containing protein, partial [Opitutus sp.]|nr:4Fe-4S dicluster domain-containing protein [Opitutus sp.]
FRKFLHDGVLENTAFAVTAVTFSAAGIAGLLADAPRPAAVSKTSLEVRFIGDYTMDDGRYSNNGWLQEYPDPISRLMWDNAILISPRLAREIGAYPHGSPVQVARVEPTDDSIGRDNAFIAEVTVGGKKLRGPVHIQPGLSNYTIILPLGYGRRNTGRVGTGAGFDAYPLRTTSAMHFVGGATIVRTDEKKVLADAQAHWSMEGRDIIREANTEEYLENPAYVKEDSMESETPPVLGAVGAGMTPQERATQIPRGNSLYVTPSQATDTGFKGPHQWGMSIDLNTCIGCNACVVACQAENNIPIVGRDQAIRGREMHWIRLDRYYSDGLIAPGLFGGDLNHVIPGDSDDPMFSPQVSLQPVTCQQCELAPCEMVCPVNATVHDDEGLNAMVYNRCIGTRYCANNCPYKVRRFNYFDYNEREIGDFYLGPIGPHGMPELVQMVKNPEVTVRMRGVMEKCTFCVQRITNGEIRYRVEQSQAGHPENVVVPDGTIRTACQQVCPVEAIVFGNIMDPESEVSKLKALPQDYQLLGYLNTRPRLTYLGKLRNPNPRMPDYTALPLSRVEHARKNVPPGFEEHPEKQGEGKGEGDHAAFKAMKSLGGLS